MPRLRVIIPKEVYSDPSTNAGSSNQYSLKVKNCQTGYEYEDQFNLVICNRAFNFDLGIALNESTVIDIWPLTNENSITHSIKFSGDGYIFEIEVPS